MKRANNLLEQIIEMDNLYLAFVKAQKGKKASNKVLRYTENWQENLFLLRQQISSGHVEVGNYYFFTIYDPKEREICAPAFSEQVLHHALMNICHPFFERKQIFDSYASRKGKGTYAALERAKKYSKKYDYYLKLDIRKFFASIDHDTLKKQLNYLFKEESLLKILFDIIDSHESALGKGVPIGNLTSQYFANHYLSGLDHYIKEQLKCKAYVRYMDDMMFWSRDKSFLRFINDQIHQFLDDELKLELKPFQLNKTKHGVPFLGYRLFPNHVRLAKRSSKRYIRKFKEIEQKLSDGVWDEAACQNHFLPLLAFTKHANAKKFRKNVILKVKGNSL